MKALKLPAFPVSFLCILLSTCGPIQDLKVFKGLDLSPPMLTEIRTLDEQRIEISFNEPVEILASDTVIEPDPGIVSIRTEEERVIITVEVLQPGYEYFLEIVAEDRNKNSINTIASFYGFNPCVPLVKLNEFTTRGSSSHPDMVEIKILKGGNMGGIVLYQGTPGNWKDRFIFPPFTVLDGDFIIVHFKPKGTADEINETESKSQSGGLDASNNAYDFWISDGTGIGGNNGVLSLYERPGGSIIDGVLYSNRTSDMDEKYAGFGTLAVSERAFELLRDGGWIAEENKIRPEDGVNPDGSTSTRSICRIAGQDTDTRRDWYIVPTRRYSFGRENSEEIYTP